MNRNELRERYQDEICERCDKKYGWRWHGPNAGTCEGSYCDEAEDDFALKNNIDLKD